ncbi:MAG: cell division protein SepF [Actinomycetota bacterium]
MPGVWKKTLVYLGLAEDDEYDEYAYDDFGPDEEGDRRNAPVRRLPDREGKRGRDEEEVESRDRDAVVRAMPSGMTGVPRVHLVTPTAFNDAQEVGDKFRNGFSVLMNLQAANPELARRLVDFASGLAYGLSGSMQPVADKVFLISPQGVEVSAEERRRLVEERGFFNQL